MEANNARFCTFPEPEIKAFIHKVHTASPVLTDLLHGFLRSTGRDKSLCFLQLTKTMLFGASVHVNRQSQNEFVVTIHGSGVKRDTLLYNVCRS